MIHERNGPAVKGRAGDLLGGKDHRLDNAAPGKSQLLIQRVVTEPLNCLADHGRGPPCVVIAWQGPIATVFVENRQRGWPDRTRVFPAHMRDLIVHAARKEAQRLVEAARRVKAGQRRRKAVRRQARRLHSAGGAK